MTGSKETVTLPTGHVIALGLDIPGYIRRDGRATICHLGCREIGVYIGRPSSARLARPRCHTSRESIRRIWSLCVNSNKEPHVEGCWLRDDKVREGEGHSCTVVYHCSDIVACAPSLIWVDQCSRHTRDIDQGPSVPHVRLIIARRGERSTVLRRVDRCGVRGNSTSIVFANIGCDHSR
jgi:hypothetical protein